MKSILILLFSIFTISVSTSQKYEKITVDNQVYVLQKDTLSVDGVYIDTKIPIELFKDEFIERVFFIQSRITRKQAEITAIQKDIDDLNFLLMQLEQAAGVILQPEKK